MNQSNPSPPLQVSVVLPTYNRRDRLERVLAALARQTVPVHRWEAIVVSDGSSDGTNEWLAAQQPPFAMRCLFQENLGVAVARNNGVAQARGQIVLFIDDDVIPAPAWMAEHLRYHERHARAVVLGPMLPPPDSEFPRSAWVRWEEAMLDKQYQAMTSGEWQPGARQFYTGNTSLPRDEIVAAGGFDPSFRRAEDVELGYRLADRGLVFFFNPAAQGLHYAERSFESWCRTPYLYGRYDVIMTRNKGQDWLLPAVASEFHGRNGLVRALARLCVGHEGRKTLAVALLSRLARLGDGAGIRALPRYAYSGVFNLLHYQGVRDEMGSTAAFWQLIARHAPGASEKGPC
ncbi:MAG: glycosyltransferase family 2 protein [Chloroflexota bacterium]